MFTSFMSIAVSVVLGLSPVLAHPAPAPSPAIIDNDGVLRTPASVAYLVEERVMTLTAYSSSADETDSTPFITASGSKTRHGVVASNDLPFGTRIRIQDKFGDRVFTVEDRMHRRYTGKEYMDLWMPSKHEALRFGVVRNATVEILKNPQNMSVSLAQPQ